MYVDSLLHIQGGIETKAIAKVSIYRRRTQMEAHTILELLKREQEQEFGMDRMMSETSQYDCKDRTRLTM